jgi:hypothetical protein
MANGTLDLSGDSTQWHTHSGDDPAWGQSAFDDTAWPAVSLASQPGSRAGWAWFRIRLHLSDPHAPLALLVTGGDGTWEVYANGRKIPGPSLLPPLQMTYPRSRVVPLNASGDVEIALRTFVPESSMLNERLQGRGLVTCQALRITVDGSAILANAGHLPPYLNGREIAIVGSLPLGAIPGIDFPLLRFHLDPGGTLTLISDGVVEAQNPAGELFGFDRTAAISTQTADQIAKAAERFGQEDDITVLTVMRAV